MMKAVRNPFILLIFARLSTSCYAQKLRGYQKALVKSSLETKRKLLDLDSFAIIDETFGHSQFDKSNNDVLSLVNKVSNAPVNKVQLDVYMLPETFDSDDYVGQLEGLLPTPTVYHNDNFFLSMDIREHRYEMANVDEFDFVYDLKSDSMTSQAPQPINDDDLIHRLDQRSIVGLLGLLPGENPVAFLQDDVIIESKTSNDKKSVFGYLGKIDPVFNKIQSDALTPLNLSNDWVGMIHGLLPGGTKYHNDDFYLPFATLEHQYENLDTKLMSVIDKIVPSDKVDPEVYKAPQELLGTDGREIVGLLGLLPGSSGLHMIMQNDEMQKSHLEEWVDSTSVVSLLAKAPIITKVNPEAYKSPVSVKNNGYYVGQLHGLLPDLDDKMKYLKFGWDDLIGRDKAATNNDDGAGFVVDVLGLVRESKTSGESMDAPESGNDVVMYLMTPNPTSAPSTVPSLSPSISSAPSSIMIRHLVSTVDFAIPDAPSNAPFALKNGAQIKPGPNNINALRIDRDGPYALIPGVNIGPSQMPECTLMIGIYLESIANHFGWVFGHEQGGYDRTILMHDNRFGGGIASAVGKTWNPWNNAQKPPTKEWIHVTAVFRQSGASYVYLNGVRSDRETVAYNSGGLEDLWVGRPHWNGHWTDSWIKEVKVFDAALSDEVVKAHSDQFLKVV